MFHHSKNVAFPALPIQSMNVLFRPGLFVRCSLHSYGNFCYFPDAHVLVVEVHL